MASADVIITGSGPAGCAAAMVCARAGLGVLMVTDQAGHYHDLQDISVAPIVPLESIHPGVGTLLDQLGAGGIDRMAAKAKYAGIYASGIYTPVGEDEITGMWFGLHIDRRLLDAELLHIAELNGVQIQFANKAEKILQENNRVIGIQTNTGDFFGTYVIDASGHKGWGGRQLNFTQHFYSPPLVCWTGVSAIDEHFPFEKNAAHFMAAENGWTWLAPQPPWHCTWTRLSMRGEKSFLPPDELKNNPVLSSIDVGNRRWRMFRPLCTEGMLLCGDAAGLLDPAAGQGIFNALWSGIVAGQTVVKCLQEPMFEAIHLAQYDDWFASQFETKVSQLSAYYQEQGIRISGARE